MIEKCPHIKEKLDIIFNENVLEEKLEDVMGERFGRYSKLSA